MLKRRPKHLNASMFKLPDQDLVLVLGENMTPEEGQISAASSHLFGEHFSGGMGVTLNSKEVCIGIAIDQPVLEVSDDLVKLLVDEGINASAAYNMAAVEAYNQLARGIAENLFKEHVEPTFKIEFQDAHDGQRSVKKVEVLMKGEPTKHPFWTLENY